MALTVSRCRIELRRRWRSLLVLTPPVALGAGVVLATVPSPRCCGRS